MVSFPQESARQTVAEPGLISRRKFLAAPAALGLVGGASRLAMAGPQGQMTWGVHISLAPTWFDPAETPGLITPYMVLYALHDAVVKPMPGDQSTPSLAESWSASPDGLTYDFVIRTGVKFHNGDLVTAEDVKFSFERYKGNSKDSAEDQGCGGRGGGPEPCPLHADAAMARLHDVLRLGDRSGLDRAEEIRRESRR